MIQLSNCTPLGIQQHEIKAWWKIVERRRKKTLPVSFWWVKTTAQTCGSFKLKSNDFRCELKRETSISEGKRCGSVKHRENTSYVICSAVLWIMYSRHCFDSVSQETSYPLVALGRFYPSVVSWKFLYSRTSLIRTPQGRSEESVLERCPYKRGHCDDFTSMTPLTVLSGQ